MIKPCDKGAGIIILNFNDYMQSCYEQLYSRLSCENGESKPYYQKVHDVQLQVAKSEIAHILKEGLENKIILKK